MNEFMHEGAMAAPWFGISLGCCIGGVIGAFLFSRLDNIPRKIGNCSIAILISIILFGAGVNIFAPREMIPRYQVIIDDEVKFNDFMNNYKIIKQDGLIYTVEELDYNE